jgi:hypothetical protein
MLQNPKLRLYSRKAVILSRANPVILSGEPDPRSGSGSESKDPYESVSR